MSEQVEEVTTVKVRSANVTDGADAVEVFHVAGAGVRPNGSPGLGVVLNDGKTVELNARHTAVKRAIADGILVDVAAERKAERAKAKAEEKAKE